jgi:predicted protein tyrosine phosphatase
MLMCYYVILFHIIIHCLSEISLNPAATLKPIMVDATYKFSNSLNPLPHVQRYKFPQQRAGYHLVSFTRELLVSFCTIQV